MIADKNIMLIKAQSCENQVRTAKENCDRAYMQLLHAADDIDRCWKGESGMAMAQALESAKKEINSLYGRLETLETEMHKQSRWIYDNWKSEEES